MQAMPLDIGTLHFIGIGGIGMSGIAEVLVDLGYCVQGSDLSDSANVKRLRAKGVFVSVGHAPGNIKTKDGELPAAVVVSSAVKDDNVELIAARAGRIPIVRRAAMLAELMRLKWAITIGGTHGKTTTTAMVGEMLEACDFDPTVINGGIVNSYGTNTRLGKSEYMVVEADESDGTFTRLPASVVAVTNIDPEHMEHYGSFENVLKAYTQFIKNIPFYGYAVMCADHPQVQGLIASVSDRTIVTYGFNTQADVRAVDLRATPQGSYFDVIFSQSLTGDRDILVKDMFLPMAGRHNVQNALVALSVAYKMDVPVQKMKQALAGFTGVKRRFTKTGEVGGVTVVDDYAHHPIEIETVLKAARSSLADSGGRVIAVMQPHRYSRLQDLFDAFCTCFHEADIVFIADVYEAGETPIEGINRDTLVQGILDHGHKNVQALGGPENLADVIAGTAAPGDFVICMGAGDITVWAYDLPKKLEEIQRNSKDNAA